MVIVLDGQLGIEKSTIVARDDKGQRMKGKDTIDAEEMRND